MITKDPIIETQPLLSVELIPTTCFFSNVRTNVKVKDWDKIRHLSYAAAGHKCEVCKGLGKKQGFKHNLECHEIWEYDDVNHIQKLIGLISLCPRCHMVKHIGRAIAIGKERECIRQLALVNGWTKDLIDNHINEAYETHRQRSEHEWSLDISILSEAPYELKINTTKERIFKVKKYKKKRRGKKTKGKRKSGLNRRPSRY